MIHGNDGQMHIIIERQEYMRANPGIDILLYDNILEEVADIVGFQAAGDYICIR